jgi:hypothetical protein
MVSPRHLQRVRTVIDHDNVGTKVSAEVLKADTHTAFPLLAAMGIEMTQTLFIGEDTLLIEGPSDLIFLDVLSNAAEASGRTGLDPRWVKTPIGGSGKLSTFATLLGANKLKVFWGGPLVARELETGTSQFVWMQTITRRHWLTSRPARHCWPRGPRRR